MRPIRIRVLVTGVAAIAIGIYAETGFSGDHNVSKNDPVTIATGKGLKWLVSVQGQDGGWGQDGGETSYVRQGERLESRGNDVANTAVAAEAFLHAGTTATSGEYREPLRRAVEFVLKHVEQSPADGLAITDQKGTQIQRKLGPFIDTFLTSKLLAELDGSMGDAQANERVRQSLQKCVAKIENNQLQDGSWNISGGWAPILGTSLASQSLFIAQAKGLAPSKATMARVDTYTQLASAEPKTSAGPVSAGSGLPAGVAGSVPGGVVGGIRGGVATAMPPPPPAMAASAGVSLYGRAQQLEQLSRTEGDRKKNAKQIDEIRSQLGDQRFVAGFGSIGGEEFFSYLNISDSLRRTGGPEWNRWNGEMEAKILKLQNEDGTWAGHHCITGRVAVTSAAILLLSANRTPPPIQTTSLKKK